MNRTGVEIGAGVRVSVRSRWDDCDRYGHVNNAAYLAVMRAAHDAAGLPPGDLRSLEIAYRRPVPPDAVVTVDVVVLERSDPRWRVTYAMAVDYRTVADVQALWQVGISGVAADLPAIEGDAGGRPFRFDHAVQSHELGPDGSARPQAILQWLEHAVFRAAARAGWPRDRMEAAGFVTFVVGHHLVLGATATENDEIIVASRLIELRRVSGTWHHEVRRSDGVLVAADRARGAFLDLEGRIRPAPPELLDDLLRGEPREPQRA